MHTWTEEYFSYHWWSIEDSTEPNIFKQRQYEKSYFYQGCSFMHNQFRIEESIMYVYAQSLYLKIPITVRFIITHLFTIVKNFSLKKNILFLL
jgi:hypothetical protein